jgi:hypothetical protein
MGLSVSSRDLSSSRVSFFRPIPLFDRGHHPFVPTRASLTSTRAGAVKVGRRTNLAACSAFARPHLDSFEHDGTLGAVGMTIGGEPALGRDQSRHNLVSGGSKDPNHDAAMRIGSEAPKRRTHSFPRHKSHGTNRDPATSNRHRRPVTSARTDWAETVGCLRRPRFMMRDAERRRPAPRPLARAATRRSEACAPRPRSWACECRERSWCGLETTAPRRCPSGT